MKKGEWPDKIDHKNHIRTDNSWKNLRSCTQAENCKNKSKGTKNTSGTVGVAWVEGKQKWKAFIGVNGKTKHIGYYEKEHEAKTARKNKEQELCYHINHGA